MVELGIDVELAPLVVVEGFLGDPGLDCWRHLIECQRRHRLVISVQLGAMSSIHDRCCELFYQIKGGRVDYGEQHSLSMGHCRFGLEYQGAYPKWDKENPVHLLGHSLGGLTIWHLQQMLHRNEFGFNANAKWIRSIGTFSAPLRGTTSTYIMGCCEGSPSVVRNWTIGSFLYFLAYFLAWLNWPKLNGLIFDPCLKHWNLDHHSLLELLYNMYTCIRFDEGKDNAAYDLSVEIAESMNKQARTFPTTYYRSYAVSMTSQCMSLFHVPDPTRRSPLVVLIASLMGGFTFQSLSYQSENWRDNDGIVPTISQCHPGDCRPGHCHHRIFDETKESIHYLPVPGQWAVTHIKDASHFEVIRCPLPTLPPSYRIIMEDYWEWVDQIDQLSDKKRPKLTLKPISKPTSPFLYIPFPSSPISLR